MSRTVERDHPVGLSECPGCPRMVVFARDELGRWQRFDPQASSSGLFVIGLEVDGLGDPPVLELRARVATDCDPPGQRWLMHECPATKNSRAGAP